MLFVILLESCATLTAQELSFPLQSQRLLFLGDSITNAGHFVVDIETQLRLQGLSQLPEIVNIGLSSETCTGLSEPDHPFPRPNVHERLERALQKFQPDVVVACYGMNDGIYYPFDEERFQAYQRGIKDLVEKVHASGAKIVLLTPPPFDAQPLQNSKGKLLPEGAEKYAWFAIYEGYDQILQRYGKWLMSDNVNADMVIDIHSPVAAYLEEQRTRTPDFHIAADGVHMNETGHRVIAQTILKAWGVESWEQPAEGLTDLVRQKEVLLRDAWLSFVGHKRPGVKAGLPIEDARQEAMALNRQIEILAHQCRQPKSASRPSAAGVVHQVHFPAELNAGQLHLFADYYLWIPDAVDSLRGIIVHQHGCGPGASIGGQTAADDLHWQALAAKHQCALLGSSYEPRKGVNCRLWCDPRNGSAQRFLEALKYFARHTEHPELSTVPWCLWGHSGGGFWASLMQTLYPERIVAIWLQSGTAYGYWKKGEIPAPVMSATVYSVPVMGNPGLKEKDHERFHVAYDGTLDMQRDYLANGAAFFEFAPDPNTGHECGDSRYLSIPFFNFWLTHRLPEESTLTLKPVTEKTLEVWKNQMAPMLAEFTATGAVDDETPPPPPHNVRRVETADGSAKLTWNAAADFESGIRCFVIEQNGEQIAKVPANPVGRFGRPLFQSMSYHDTPELPLPKMEYPLPAESLSGNSQFSVRTINSVELQSTATIAE